MPTLEQLIEQARDRQGTHAERLAQARERMDKTNKRMAKEWKDSLVTQELLNKVIDL